MKRYIEVKNLSGNTIMVNPANICSICDYKGHPVIHTSDGRAIETATLYPKILSMLQSIDK